MMKLIVKMIVISMILGIFIKKGESTEVTFCSKRWADDATKQIQCMKDEEAALGKWEQMKFTFRREAWFQTKNQECMNKWYNNSLTEWSKILLCMNSN